MTVRGVAVADVLALGRGVRRAGSLATSVARDRLLVAALLLTAWWSLHAALGEYWMPSPAAVLGRVSLDVASGRLPREALYTLAEAAIGLALGSVPAILLPALMHRRRVLLGVLDPFMDAAYGVPKLLFAPLFLIWFGVGVTGKIAVVAMSAFFIVYVHTVLGVRAIEPRLCSLARVLGTSARGVVLRIVLPAVAPFAAAGVRVATPYAIGGAIVAELLSSNRGLGYLLQLRVSDFDITGVFAVLVAVVLIVSLCNLTVAAAETRVPGGRIHAVPARQAS